MTVILSSIQHCTRRSITCPEISGSREATGSSARTIFGFCIRLRGDRHTLLLTARKCVCSLPSSICQSDSIQLLESLDSQRFWIHHRPDTWSSYST